MNGTMLRIALTCFLVGTASSFGGSSNETCLPYAPSSDNPTQPLYPGITRDEFIKIQLESIQEESAPVVCPSAGSTFGPTDRRAVSDDDGIRDLGRSRPGRLRARLRKFRSSPDRTRRTLLRNIRTRLSESRARRQASRQDQRLGDHDNRSQNRRIFRRLRLSRDHRKPS